MTRLFELVARPLATFQTQGAFLGGLRLMGIDGTVFDVPDTEANARVFGYPGTRKGTKRSLGQNSKQLNDIIEGKGLRAKD